MTFRKLESPIDIPFGINKGSVIFEQYWKETTSNWASLFPFYKLRRIVEDSYLPSIIIDTMLQTLRNLQIATAIFYKTSKTCFDLEKALDLLDVYYDLLRLLLRYADELLEGLVDNYAAFLRLTLNLGYDLSKNIVTPFAPRYLLAVLEIDRQFDSLYESDLKRSVFTIYLNRFLQSFVVFPDGTLGHTDGLCIKQHSCYERINALSLYDKIIYEKPSKVLIAGNVDTNSVLELHRLFHNIEFIVFTNDATEYAEKGLIFYNYQKLFQSSKTFKKWIQSSDLLFFLDCYNLYTKISAIPYEKMDSFLQQVSYFTFRNLYRRMQYFNKVLLSNMDVTDQNPFSKVQKLVLGAAYGNSFPAEFKKKINLTICHFIEEQVSEKTTYFYFSDLNDRNIISPFSTYSPHYLRKEIHRGKGIYIFRYGQKHDRPLLTCSDHNIVFDLWQFANYAGLPNPSFHSLVSIDYSNGLDKLRILCEPNCEYYIKSFIYPCLLHISKNSVEQDSILANLFSFLEDAATSIDDLLFLHFLSNSSYIGEVELVSDSTFLCKVPIKLDKKYSHKRFYQELIFDYDSPAEYFPSQLLKLKIMEHSGLSKKEAFSNLKDACVRLEYTDSYLYRNCCEFC